MRILLLSWLLAVSAWAGTFPDTLVEKPLAKLSDQDYSDWGKLALAGNSEKWQHGETPHFVIHFFKSGQKVATRAEEFYAEIREFFGNRTDLLGNRKSHIFAFQKEQDWDRFCNGIQMRGIAGVTRGNEFFYIATTDGVRFDSKGKVQAHEMTHLVFNRFYAGQVPLWLNEGIAEYFGQRKTSSTADFRKMMSMAANYDVDRLFSAIRYPATPDEIRAFYAESAIVVDFLTYTADRKPLLPKFVEALTTGQSLEKALNVYGFADIEAFKSAYAKFRKTRYK